MMRRGLNRNGNSPVVITLLIIAIAAVASSNLVNNTGCPIGGENNNVVCSGNGGCNDGICTCVGGFSGPSCSTPLADISMAANATAPQITMSTVVEPAGSTTASSTTSITPPPQNKINFIVSVAEVREVDQSNNVVASVNMDDIKFTITVIETAVGEQVSYFAVLNKTEITITISLINCSTVIFFADQELDLSPNELKMTLTVKNWPFVSKQNLFEVVFDAGSENSDNVTTKSDSQGVLRWVSLAVNDVSLYGQFLPYAQLDNKTQALNISYSQEDTHRYVITRCPMFSNELVVDPNYVILVDDKANPNSIITNNGGSSSVSTTAIIAGVVCSVGGVAIIAFVWFVVKPKVQLWRNVKSDKQLQQL